MEKRFRFILVALLASLVAWLLMCTYAAGVIPVGEIVSIISLPVIVYMVSAVVFVRFGRRGRIAFFLILCALALFETILGLLQLMELYPSNNQYHILTGNFMNQGLYGALMALASVACLYEFLHTRKKGLRVVLAIMFVIFFVMMAISVSRAAWIAFTVSAFAILHKESGVSIDFRKKRNVVAVAAAVIVAGILVIVIKPESALSRVHIWRMDCRAISEHPLLGAGSAAEVGAYSDAQEHFFAKKDRSQLARHTADCPLFAFNEFLKFGMQGGVPALLLSVAVYVLAVLLLVRKRSEYAYLLLAFGTFSLFSYPLSSVTLCSILAVLLSDASVSDRKGFSAWSAAAVAVIICISPMAGHRIDVLKAKKEFRFETDSEKRFGKYYPELKYDFEFVSLYGFQLYEGGYYGQALKILSEGEEFHSNPTYFCLIGHCREMLGDKTGALKSYKKAINLVPERMMPYYMLVNYYKSEGRISEAKALKEKALSLPYDPSQSETVRVREKIESVRLR